MEPLAPNGSSFGRQQDPNAILNECKKIDSGINSIERDLEQLKILQQRSLDDPDSSIQSSTNRQLDSMSAHIMAQCQTFAKRIKEIKQQPDSGSPRNAPQVGKVDRRLKAAVQQYQTVESDFRARLQDQMARQYRIVNPNASQAEVNRVVSDTSNQQIFSQALMQSDRRGQSRAALSAVEDRHAAIQKIESQMQELAQLFSDMEALVVQQEEAVTLIEQKGEEVVENIQGGNEHLVKGVKSARARNRKKWWCLLICGMLTWRLYYPRGLLLTLLVIIIIIVVIVVVIYVKVINPPKSTKRSLVDALQTRDALAEGLAWIPRGRSILPDTPPVPALE
jgi:syntaxin 1B/2/3